MDKIPHKDPSSSERPPRISLRSVIFLVIGSVLFIVAGLSHRFVPRPLNGIIAQLQIIISIMLIFSSHRFGWKLAVLHNLIQTVVTSMMVFRFHYYEAVPGIMMPILSILIIVIIAIDRNSLWLKHRELIIKKKELEEANEATAKAMKAKGEFLSLASHELRTPMNNIMGYLELMGHGMLPAEQREFLETVTVNARNLVDLLNDILDLSKIENGYLELTRKNFSPGATIKATLRLFEPTLASRDLTLIKDISDIPQASGDPMRLGQVLVNLMGNAMKFTPRGGTIRLRASAQEGQEGSILTVSVADTGIGIPREKQDVIFEPFIQVAPSGPEPLRGTGLGLAISSQLVERMGGVLSVDSKPGAGSTFSFSIPLAPPCREELLGTSCDDPEVSFTGKDYTVLIAEDTPDSLKLLSLMLKELGFSVVPAQDGAEAFTRFRERQANVLILDGQMPGLNGLEATRKIREYENQNGLSSVPIVILSAHIDEGERRAYLEAGANLSLVKPVSLMQLSQHLSRLLGLSDGDPSGLSDLERAPTDYLQRAAGQIGLPVSAIEDIFGDFIHDLPDYLEAIQLSLEPLNRLDLAKASHRLRGAAATLVLDELKSLAGRLETLAKEESAMTLSSLYAEILEEARRLDTWYRARGGEHSRG